MTSPPASAGTLGAASAIRRELGLWANVRLAEHFPGMKNHQPGTALAVVRDLTEDIGAGSIQGWATDDCGVALKVTSARASTRIARFAFDFARTRPHKRVTVASQAKVLTSTDGLFLRCALAEAENHPDIAVDEEALDALCDHLARHAARYSVLLAPRLYGGFLSGLASGIVGSVGVVAGMSRSDDVAVFEAAHGSAPHYAGQNKVNPCSMILAGAMLLDAIGEPAAAQRIRASVAKVIADGSWTTYDLGGTRGTTDMTTAIIGALES
jgi:isocitrate dehydrogenase (NAD+)